MIYRERSHSSVEVLDEEDPNVPQDVQCRTQRNNSRTADDDGSACSEISDGTMQHYGWEFDCKPDIAEVAGMTLGVNYGDLALASENIAKRRPSLVKPDFSEPGNTAEMTWSQLLDHQAQVKPNFTMQPMKSSEKYVWSKGYDEPFDSGGGLNPSPFALDSMISRSQRSMRSGAASVPTLSSRRRPLRAIKRFISRGKSSKAVIPPAVFVDYDKKEGRQQLQECS
eukprot:CAMPEP_0176011190 /NCGR_PEP_ID=MMETSP0120_2-20121206/5158_1 /TAXON_ID=160619 /ORGANISM="Kryptoperidinium foliaceum, Strain CCMP 1326" /LENGTH=224 /DNA_ID=CAMNT_0017344049 /DNA_START=207 /DNA_END=881 /DNA_ORIENTATION=+